MEGDHCLTDNDYIGRVGHQCPVLFKFVQTCSNLFKLVQTWSKLINSQNYFVAMNTLLDEVVLEAVEGDHCLKDNDYWTRRLPKRPSTYKRLDCCCTFHTHSNWTWVYSNVCYDDHGAVADDGLQGGLHCWNYQSWGYCQSEDELLVEGLAGDIHIGCINYIVGHIHNDKLQNNKTHLL